MDPQTLNLVAKRAVIRLLANMARADGNFDQREHDHIDAVAEELDYVPRPRDLAPGNLRRLAGRIPFRAHGWVLERLARMPALDGHASLEEISIASALADAWDLEPPEVPGVQWPDVPPVLGVLDVRPVRTPEQRESLNAVAVSGAQDLSPTAVERFFAEGPPESAPAQLVAREPQGGVPHAFTRAALLEDLSLCSCFMGVILFMVALALVFTEPLAGGVAFVFGCVLVLPAWAASEQRDGAFAEFLERAHPVPFLVTRVSETRSPSDNVAHTVQRAELRASPTAPPVERSRLLHNGARPFALGEWAWALVGAPHDPILFHEDLVNHLVWHDDGDPLASNRRAVALAELELDRRPPSPSQPQVRSAGRVQISVQGEQRCPYCRDTLAESRPRELMTCKDCKVVFHRECIQEARSCSTIGCRNRRVRSQRA